MDTIESLALVEDSMVPLRVVQQYFPTKRVQQVVRMAEYLVRMCQRKKLEAAETLSRSAQGALDNRVFPTDSPAEKDSQTPISHTSAGNSLAAVQRNEVNLPLTPSETHQVGLDLFHWEKFFCSDFASDFGFSDPYSVSHTEELL
jgi:hypothetical protein